MAIGVSEHSEVRGLSARHMVLLFLAGVAVCGVFFSLGFLVGFNERFTRSTPATERVGAPSVVPPAVNPPEENVSVTVKDAAAGHPPVNAPPDATSPAGGAPASPEESKPAATGEPFPAPVPSSTKSEVGRPLASAATPAEVGEGITLQVAAMRTKQDAEALVNVLKERGFPVFVVTPEYADTNDNLFRVQVGPFNTREEAEKARGKLVQEGFKPFIRH